MKSKIAAIGVSAMVLFMIFQSVAIKASENNGQNLNETGNNSTQAGGTEMRENETETENEINETSDYGHFENQTAHFEDQSNDNQTFSGNVSDVQLHEIESVLHVNDNSSELESNSHTHSASSEISQNGQTYRNVEMNSESDG